MFKKNKYAIIKKAIDNDLALFLYNYLLMKKQVYDTCLKERYISPFETILGYYEKENEQIPNTYSFYSDVAMETLMLKCQPIMEKTTGLKLYPAYTYGRVYKKGDILKRHKDRFSCEISTTMNLGGDPWPIYVEAKKNVGLPKDGFPAETRNPGSKVTLKPGDMLVYKGMVLEHWRDTFLGDNCAQVFLHYNDVNSKDADKNIFDGRPHLGLPAWFKGMKL